MQPGNMQGKVALVTGASDFVGRATALRLARAGASICLVDGLSDELEDAAAAVRSMGAEANVFAADIAQRESCIEAVNTAVAAFGKLDALCNVATIFRPSRSINATQSDWERSLG